MYNKKRKNRGLIRYLTNQCCGSGMFIPDPGTEFFPSRIPDHKDSRITKIPGSRVASASKNLSILPQKIVSRLSEIWSGMFIPDPDTGYGSWLFTHPRSRIRIRSTVTNIDKRAINRREQPLVWMEACTRRACPDWLLRVEPRLLYCSPPPRPLTISRLKTAYNWRTTQGADPPLPLSPWREVEIIWTSKLPPYSPLG